MVGRRPVGVGRWGAVVGVGCVVALAATASPGPSAVAVSALGRPELAPTRSMAMTAVVGDRAATRELQIAAESREQMDALVAQATRAQHAQAEHHRALEAGSAGASGAAAESPAASQEKGGGGSYSATSLSPSATWSAGGSSGSFSWTYPLRVVPSTGPVPKVEVTYDSGSVDGRLPSTNNQPSWVGEGFDLPTSYVERSYNSCDDDKKNASGTTVADNAGKYDLCWKNDNATLVLNGRTSELVRDVKVDGVQRWRMKDDDASIVEQLSGADNGAHDGEYWRVTTPDGTRYSFGLDKLPQAGQADPRTNSVFTVPVFGDDVDEPCHGEDLESSGCVQGWRWNLDLVADTFDNAATYWYAKESNSYAKLGDVAKATSYVRGGYLTRIDYGQRLDALFTGKAGQRVVFTVAERCLASATNCAELNRASQSYWPDVPFSSLWEPNTAAAQAVMVSPSFFTRKLLSGVMTQVWDATAKGYRGVDSWEFSHDFLDPGNSTDTGDQTLWLSGIRQTTSADGKPILPEVKITPTMLENRWDVVGDDITELELPRVHTITSETGAVTTVKYSDPVCAKDKPDPKSNTTRCFPVYWAPQGGTERHLDWFNKYVVLDVFSADTTGDSKTVRTNYTYSGDAAWHHSEDPISPPKWRTWNQWRGYERVTTTIGDDKGGTQSKSLSVYLRGMNGDEGRTGKVTVTGEHAKAITDEDPLAGFLREQITYDGDREVSGSWFEPWTHQSASFDYGTAEYVARAHYVRTGAEHHWTAITPAKTPTTTTLRWRTTSTTYDEVYGMPQTIEDSGDQEAGGDETCERTWYARNTKRGLTSLVSRTQKLATTCAKTDTADLPADSSRSGAVISDLGTAYDQVGTDEATTWTEDATPTRGAATWTARAQGYTSGREPIWQRTTATTFDALGRAMVITDAQEATSSTTYTPADAEPLTQTASANALGHTTTTTYDPAWRVPTKVVDANNKATEFAYDPLGRLTAVWLPTQHRIVVDTEKPPYLRFDYHVSNTAPSWVSTSTIKKDQDAYNTSYTIYDALLRERQTQVPSPQGGRVIETLSYDGRGLLVGKDADMFDQDNSPDGAMAEPVTQRAPEETRTSYDGVGRAVTTTFSAGNDELWSTTTTYTGDSVATTAPEGGSASRVFTDATGQVTERREYSSTSPDATDYLATTFEYTTGGQVKKVTGPDGSTWSYDYDLFGRQITANDPDKGTTTSTYTNLDQVATTTNNGHTLEYRYDVLGRRTGMWQETVTDANKLAAWGYDQVSGAKGQLDTATRYVGGAKGLAYTWQVTVFDTGYRPTTRQVKLPATDPLVAAGVPATLSFTENYSRDGTLESTTEPAVAGLPAETLARKYNSLGMALTLQAAEPVVNGTAYSAFGDVEELHLGTGPTQANQLWITNAYETGTHRLKTSEVTDGTHDWHAQSLSYDYDDAGNVLSVFDTADRGGMGTADYQCFAYDRYQQLQHAWTPATADCDPTKRSTSVLGGAAPYWDEYKYNDANGLRTSEVRHESGTSLGYTYDKTKPHQLSSLTTTRADGSATTVSYDYDDAGNTTARPGAGGAQTLTWDAEGHLATTQVPGETAAQDKNTAYLYDPDGNLLLKRPVAADGKSPADGQSVLYLGGTEVRLTTTGNTQTLSAARYYSHLDRTVAVRTSTPVTTTQGTTTSASKASATSAAGTTLTWLIGDRNGTGEVAIDAKTMEVTRRYTTPFGAPRGKTTQTDTTNTLAKAVSWIDDKGFLGKPLDAATGLTHVGAREYDTTIGRFISVDPVLDTSDAQSLNGYTYAGNNPVTLADPSGLAARNTASSWLDNSVFWNQVKPVGSTGGRGVEVEKQLPPTVPTTAAPQDHGGGFGGWFKKKVGQARQWTSDHMDVIVEVGVGIAVGVAVGGACALTAGIGCALAAGALAGTLGSLAGYGTRVATTDLQFSWAGLGIAAAVGAVSGMLGAGIGSGVASLGKAALSSGAARAMGQRAASAMSGSATKAKALFVKVKSSDSPSANHCFVAGTKVATEHGLKAIEKIKIGDRVWSFNQRTGKKELRRVRTTFKSLAAGVMTLALATGATLTSTPGHRMYEPTKGWTHAQNLATGDTLQLLDGSTTTITRITTDQPPTEVYNLEIDTTHTYYAGTTPVLTHNQDCGLFHNQMPSGLASELRTAEALGVSPVGPGGAGFDAAIGSGTIKWAVRENGELMVVPKTVRGVEISHSVLSGGAPVQAAGEAEIAGSSGRYFGLEINNHSGHFRPSMDSLQLGVDSFRQAGVIFS